MTRLPDPFLHAGSGFPDKTAVIYEKRLAQSKYLLPCGNHCRAHSIQSR